MKPTGVWPLLEVLARPTRAFEKLGREPSWIAALAAAVLIRSARVPIQASEAWRAGLAMGLGTVMVILLAWAATWLSLKLMRCQISLRASLSILLHGAMPLNLAAVLTLIAISNERALPLGLFRSGRLEAFSPMLLVPDNTAVWVWAFVGTFDIFSVWSVALLVIGYRSVGRISTRSAILIVVPLWFLTRLASLGGQLGLWG